MQNVDNKYAREFEEQCDRVLLVDRFASGDVWISSKFTLKEYTLQREAGIVPSHVKFSVINADGPKDVKFESLLSGNNKMFTDGEAAAIDAFLRPGLGAAGFEFIAGPECHKTTDFFAKNKVTGGTAAVQATFVRFEEPKGPGNTSKSVNALKKYAEAGVITIVGIICKEALHGAYIITPAFLPDLRAFQSPKSTFQRSCTAQGHRRHRQSHQPALR